MDYDFYIATWRAPKGAILIAALLIGWLLGGAFVYFGLVLRLRRRLRVQARGSSRIDRDADASQPASPQSRTPVESGR
ncbi:MAG: hypothetical protein QM741_12325 [Rudaea sp.]|uniref:hypothetical protein n=1 Tax=Rudaea sp. TaxID=2136325 RepID=UPI0039E2CB30